MVQDKKALLKSRKVGTSTEDVKITKDLIITVRALRREEVDECKKDAGEDKAAFERYLIAAGLVDPEMSREDVDEWIKEAPAGDGVKAMDAIARLSGMDEGAPKSRVQTPRKRPRR